MSWQPPSEDWQSALQQPEDWQKRLRELGDASQTPVWRSPEPEAASAPPADPVAAPPAAPAPPAWPAPAPRAAPAPAPPAGSAPAAPAGSTPAPPAERQWQPAPRYVARPSAPGAAAALALGIVGLGFWFLGPFAWYHGARARKAISRSGGQLGGQSVASIGMVLGILETVGLILFTVLIVIGIAVSGGESS